MNPAANRLSARNRFAGNMQMDPLKFDTETSSKLVPADNIQATEIALVGSLIQDPDLFDLVSGVASKDFAFRPAAICFEYIKKFVNQELDIQSLNEVTLCSLEGVNQYCTVAMLHEWKRHATASVDSIVDFVNIISNASQVRHFNALLSGAQSDVSKGANIASVVSKITEASETSARKSSEAIRAGEFAVEALHELANMPESNDGFIISSGHDDLDSMISGFIGGQFIVIGARPAMGKTSFALGVAANAASKGKHVAVFSYEMGGKQLSLRIVSEKSGVNVKRIRDRAMTAEEWDRAVDAATSISSLPLYFNDNMDLSFEELLADVRKRHRKGELDMLVIDYLQLIEIPDYKGNRQDMITHISRQLKKLALKLNIPVIALSQLNRSLEQRVNKRPVMSDLRESGAIEQDADVIMFIYRDEVYTPETQDKGIAEIIIGKQRDGPIGTVRLAFKEETASFSTIRNIKDSIK